MDTKYRRSCGFLNILIYLLTIGILGLTLYGLLAHFLLPVTEESSDTSTSILFSPQIDTTDKISESNISEQEIVRSKSSTMESNEPSVSSTYNPNDVASDTVPMEPQESEIIHETENPNASVHEAVGEDIYSESAGRSEAEQVNQMFSDNWVRAEEWTINDVPFWQASEEDIQTIYPPDMRGVGYYWNEEENCADQISFRPENANGTLLLCGCRGITTAITLEDFLLTLGATEKALPEIEAMEYHVGNYNFFSASTAEYNFRVYVEKWSPISANRGIVVIGSSYSWRSGKIQNLNFQFYEDTGKLQEGNLMTKAI